MSLHHPFDADVFARAAARRALRHADPAGAGGVSPCRDRRCSRAKARRRSLAAWRAPERLAASAGWRERDAVLVDVPIFGEAGFGRRAGAARAAGRCRSRSVRSPRRAAAKARSSVAELAATATDTVALRGPMVPRHAFPPGIERSDLPHFAIGRDGLVDTGYACRIDPVSQVAWSSPGRRPASSASAAIASRCCDLLETIGRIDGGATLAALPDPLIGQRLIGNAADRDAMQAALDARSASIRSSPRPFASAASRYCARRAAG